MSGQRWLFLAVLLLIRVLDLSSKARRRGDYNEMRMACRSVQNTLQKIPVFLNVRDVCVVKTDALLASKVK